MDVFVGQQPAHLCALQVGPHEDAGKLAAGDVVPVFKAQIDARYSTDQAHQIAVAGQVDIRDRDRLGLDALLQKQGGIGDVFLEVHNQSCRDQVRVVDIETRCLMLREQRSQGNFFKVSEDEIAQGIGSRILAAAYIHNHHPFALLV